MRERIKRLPELRARRKRWEGREDKGDEERGDRIEVEDGGWKRRGGRREGRLRGG